ncbi:cytosine-specific methyltransferase, partial [Trichonephila clavata]
MGSASSLAFWFQKHDFLNCRGSDTILGETSDPQELFGTFQCEDKEMYAIKCKCTVVSKVPSENWFHLGGTEESLLDLPPLESEKSFFIRNDPPPMHETLPLQDDPSDVNNKLIKCLGCIKESEDEK